MFLKMPIKRPVKDVNDAKALATSGDTSLFTSVMQNDKADSVKKVVAAAKASASANIDNVLRNASVLTK